MGPLAIERVRVSVVGRKLALLDPSTILSGTLHVIILLIFWEIVTASLRS
jgi:hypothetical protein